jgi:hypothetical protein
VHVHDVDHRQEGKVHPQLGLGGTQLLQQLLLR